MYTGMMLFFVLLLVGLNAFFVAAEFSFVKVRKTRLELRAAAGDKRARSALFGVQYLDEYLSVCQLGITLSSLGLGWIGEAAVASMLRPLFELASITNPALITSLSVAVGFSIITMLHVVFGELAPKIVSIQKAEATALLLARPMRLMYIIWKPLVTVLNGMALAVLRLAGLRPTSEFEASHSPEELRMLILDSSKLGRMDKEEGRMLDNIFSFYGKAAKDIMLHRMDVIAFAVDSSVDEVMAGAYECGHARFPVYEENRDDIIGFVHIRDVLRSRKRQDLRGLLREPLYALETLHLDKLLRQMQKRKKQFCVVLDEYGVWQGILTMEDILESIVGDIQDEFDNEEPYFVREADGICSISAALSLDELAEYMELECAPDVDMYKIIAAHFMESLERIAKPGDAIELCGCRFIISRMDRNRIMRLKVERIGAKAKDEQV